MDSRGVIYKPLPLIIGRELLENDYEDDDEWGSFLSHGKRPSGFGEFDWHRLTGPGDDGDYRPLRRGIESLEFRLSDPAKGFFDRENLRHATARVMVIKKQPMRLRAVAKDLERIRARLEDIPTLVIDDESDQASINTLNPVTQTGRTTTNGAITKLLEQLPRAQYIGYTATPFANVFVNPDDPVDLFPKDFIVSLPKPPGYMGAQDFHDLAGDFPAGGGPNQKAYVRDVIGGNDDPDNLPRALDSYVLSGALKLFRKQHHPELAFKHHTMLIHETHKKADHRRLAEAVEALIEQADYYGGHGIQRLKRLWSDDFQPICADRGKQWANPESLEDLLPQIGECLRRLQEGAKSVLIVNSENDEDTPDFDRGSVWKILVGGTKLSRGYTVEGLTVSYYRRPAGAADTLMQMGRWFGFRNGYQDLVRLFIGRNEARNTDLYLAFEAVCRDEAAFRQELQRYAELDRSDRITPKRVPPLVASHLLLPTARNKI